MPGVGAASTSSVGIPGARDGSSPVECFTSTAARDRFWAGVSLPLTAAESRAFSRKTVELARRCGEVNGDLLDHISTGDTARDLDALRKAVGDRLLTYVGLSYGSMIGQTYANLFPGRVRAMMLDGIIDAVNYTTSAETRTASDVASTDEVFDQFMVLCQRAGPGRLRPRRSRRARRPTGGEAVRPGESVADPRAQRGPARRAHLSRSAALHVHPVAATAHVAAVRGGPRGRHQR